MDVGDATFEGRNVVVADGRQVGCKRCASFSGALWVRWWWRMMGLFDLDCGRGGGCHYTD